MKLETEKIYDNNPPIPSTCSPVVAGGGPALWLGVLELLVKEQTTTGSNTLWFEVPFR